MQISRRILLACVATAIFLPGFLHADTEAQKKARAALAQKMQELSDQPAPSTPPVAQSAPQSQPTAVENTVVAPQSVPPSTAPTATATDAEIEKARQALRERMKQLESQPAAAPAAAAAVVVPAEKSGAAPSAEATATAAPAGVYFEPVPEVSNANAEKARAALHEQMKRTEQQQASQKVVAQPKPDVKAPGEKKSDEAFETLVGPPTGLSAAKEEKLKMLLELYRGDQLTPQQYHAARAKVLAEP